MKTNFFIMLICTYFLAIGNAFATTYDFKFEITKIGPAPGNQLTPLGTFAIGQPWNLPQLDPGDRLRIRNLSKKNAGTPSETLWSFDGHPSVNGGPTGLSTIGLTSSTACSITPNNYTPVTVISKVKDGFGSLNGPNYDNWNYGNEIIITIPPYNSTSGNFYLMVSSGEVIQYLSTCGCGGIYAFIPISITPTVTSPPVVTVSLAPSATVYVEPIRGQTGNLSVVEKYTGTNIQVFPYHNGFRFPYTEGVVYEIFFKDDKFVHTQLFSVPETCTCRSSRNNVSNSTNLNLGSTTLSTFPNPTTGLVNLQLENAETSETSIQVLNALGQVVLEKKVQNESNIEIDLSKAIKGIYMLHIVNGDTELTEKIIKE